MNLFGRGRRGRRPLLLLVVAIGIVGAAVLAEYVLTESPSARVTITGGQATFEEGRTTYGTYWLTPQQDNYSGREQGFPITVAPGTTFRIALPLSNTDTIPHTLSSVTVAGPFSVSTTSVPLPAAVPPHEDTTFFLTLTAPSSAGTYSFSVTLICLS
ncbi:MAG: hypothetical protein ACYDFT_02515 [Thermoplasmata archaeon]